MLQTLLKHPIRKEIIKGNKKINHKAYTKSLNFLQKIPFLLKYHKKKVIFGILVGVIIKTYDWDQVIYRKIITMRSPQRIIQGFFIKEKKEQSTILEQNYLGINLSQKTINFLIQLYYQVDKQLFFGVGRNYLYEVFSQLDMIQSDQQKRKFWIASGFFKQRNQKASGVGCVEFLQIFEEALAFRRKTDPSVSEQEFVNAFMKIFFQKALQIKRWEVGFNRDRFQQFLKNQATDNPKKQDVIIEILRKTPQIEIQELEKNVRNLGLRGLNLQDRFLYWEIKKTWMSLKCYNIHKKQSHPLTSQMDKMKLENERIKQEEEVKRIGRVMEDILDEYKTKYKQELLVIDP